MEKETTDLETPTTPEAEKPVEKSEGENPPETKELQSALAQKKHYREKAEKLEEELKASKAKPEVTPGGQNPMEVVRLAKTLEGYSEKEVEFITRTAKDDSIDSIIDASKDEWVKGAIQAQRDKVEKEKNTLEPSSRQGSAEGTKSLKEMSLDEKAEYLAEQGFVKPFPKAKPL